MARGKRVQELGGDGHGANGDICNSVNNKNKVQKNIKKIKIK